MTTNLSKVQLIKLKLVQADFNNQTTAKQIFTTRLPKKLIELLGSYGVTSELINTELGFTYKFSWKDVSKCLLEL